MRKVVMFVNISLDGFISGPDNEIDWSIPDEQLHNAAIDWLRKKDVIIFGRKTYQMMADAWPKAPEDPSMPDFMVRFANTLNPMKKIVYSKSLEKAGWNTKIKREFDPEEIRKMKKLPGKDIGIGGANLAQQFMQHNLIDEFQVLVHPVALGSGKALFYGLRERLNLEFVKSEVFRSGVVMLQYRLKNK